MKWTGSLILTFALTVFAFAVPAYADDPGTITKYLNDYTVGANGSVVVVETITVRFPDPRHGLFLTFAPSSNPQSPSVPDRASITVTRDDHSEPVAMTRTAHGLNVRIGDPEVTITGTHVYRIAYTAANAVTPGDDEGQKFSEFLWFPIGERWELPILSSRSTVHLPGRATDGSCGIGEGETDECGGVGTDTVTFDSGPLQPGTPVSIRVDYTVDASKALLMSLVLGALGFAD